ncbi:MAG TPA: sodium:solute symporter [Cytophagales bacterium]|nr:sodium:solute symporter [Cytophagales bacterium]
MSPILILSILGIYFAALLLIAYLTGKKSDTNDFFTANRQSPWYLVAFGMIGTSLSGVTFISVPGAVGAVNKATGQLNQFGYFQLVLGYLVGYFFIATVLMPIYYRMNLISIYGYLEQRLGHWSYKTGAAFFLLSRTVGSAFRLFLAAEVLQIGIFNAWKVPFFVTVFITIVLIWIYTFKGGIKTIIWTDTFQTIFLISALVISVVLISGELHLSLWEMPKAVSESPFSQIFFWDPKADNFFLKQFVSGAFIAIVMTGLDQDLMQKNLTCKHIGDAQKNMFWFCVILVFVNLLFLALGALLYMYAGAKGLALPARSDELYPMLALNHFGTLAGVFFLLGITASSYASADSALASLTTSFCVDFLNFRQIKSESRKLMLKNWVHVGFSFLLLLVIVLFKLLNDDSVVNSVFKAAGYTYGPLLGLFFFGLFTKRVLSSDYLVPFICVLSPILCYILNLNSVEWLGGYKFGFEILLLNGALTFAGLLLLSKRGS